ncbi:selenide, water dikinase SelD [Granulosicoccus sp. 3-233]|uniref:selenide, water dikinase SelD n=1 Tax=Granulosicoccus sp. 3-233 TaxID=3417969 RepID=UPI003D34007C
MNSAPIVQDVCLLGGGHSHVLLIRRWAMQALPGVRLTLVSSSSMTPYSGMLPGLIAGHYSVDDIHVDLRRLCAWAGIRFIEETAISLDPERRQIGFASRPALEFDVLSLDTGSTPDLSVPGAREHVTPVKPVHSFHARWQQIRERLESSEEERVSIGVVGSGAGGFELVTAMRHVLASERAQLFWFLRHDMPLSGRPARVGELALAAARRAGIAVITQFDVIRVESDRLVAADSREVTLDEVLWCTGAVAPDWPSAAGLAVDSRGFVSTNACLQSVSHDFIFASGDIGTQRATPSAKAGVFAVRQAPILFENIQHYLLGRKLKPYRPQKDFLSLMATGEKRAIANRGPLTVEADWVWRWKDHIDQTFMRKFSDLPVMNLNPATLKLPDALRERHLDAAGSKAGHAGAAMRCRGCGSKVGEPLLERVLTHVRADQQTDGSSPLSPAADTAVLSLPGSTLVQSVDLVNAIVDDPYLLGRIAALHALSDVVTVDATVHSVQVIATVPSGTEPIVERDLKLLMSGLSHVLEAERCALVGGHTVQGDELSLGVVVNAVLNDNSDAASSDRPEMHVGDVLILTQPLGIGTLFAGLMQGRTRGPDVGSALHHMLTSNRPAAHILRQAGAHYMTDITGFGLLGHLHRLLDGLQMGARIRSAQIPLLPGSWQLAEQGVRSSLWPENRQVLDVMAVDADIPASRLSLLCDPQTSGGLLAIVPASAQADCLERLHAAGYAEAAVIGDMAPSATITLS